MKLIRMQQMNNVFYHKNSKKVFSGYWLIFNRFFVVLVIVTLILILIRSVIFQNFKIQNNRDVSKVRVIEWSSNEREFIDDRRIFFHETSGKNYLNMKQICALESAAKNNPTRPVQLFLHSKHGNDPNYCSSWIAVLSKYPNIVIAIINETKFFQNSLLRNWYNKGEWKKSPFKSEHLSDYARILSLYEGGGLYMDLDFITLKSFVYEENNEESPQKPKINSLTNFFVFEDGANFTFANSVIHMNRQHYLIKKFLIHLNDEYDPMAWNFHGSEIITTLIREFCHPYENNISGNNEWSNPCSNVALLPHYTFFPIYYDQWLSIFQSVTKDKNNKLKNSYAIHVWNKLSHSYPVTFGSDQLYSVLSQIHCPETVRHAFRFP